MNAHDQHTDMSEDTTIPNPLFILHLEDYAPDADLIQAHLEQQFSNCMIQHACNEKEFLDAVHAREYDIVLADFDLPSYNGMRALEYLLARQPDTPFIFVTGALGEERAIATLKNGATDFVMKNNLSRLPIAIRRALKEAVQIRERKDASEKLRVSEERFRWAITNAPFPIMLRADDGEVLTVNHVWTELTGYTREDIPTVYDWLARAYGEKTASVRITVDSAFHYTGRKEWGEYIVTTKEGNHLVWEFSTALMENLPDGRRTIMTMARDVTSQKQSEIEYRTIIKTSLDGFWIVDMEANILDVNDAYCALLGYTRDELLTMKITDVEAQESHEETVEHIKKIIATGYDRFETKHRRKDGSIVDIEVSSNYDPFHGGRFFVFLRDITERLREQTRIRQLNEELERRVFERTKELTKRNRILKVLSECNEILVRAHDENDLLQSICHTLVKTGGYKMIWVGYVPSDETKRIIPMAYAGGAGGYLEELKRSWSDDELGSGPSEMAVKMNQVIVVQDIANDPVFVLWRNHALEHGFASTISLPLVTKGKKVGVLRMYSSIVNAFDAEEINLLLELSNDLAFGIDSLRSERDRSAAEAKLLENERRFRALIENSSDAISLIDASGIVVYRSIASQRLLGYSNEEMIGKNCFSFIHQEDLPIVRTMFGELLSTQGKSTEAHFRYLHKDNSWRWLDVIATNHLHEPGINAIVINFRDITERKTMEDARNKLAEGMELLLQSTGEGIFGIDVEGKCTFINDAAIKMLGFGKDEILGKKTHPLMHHRHADGSPYPEQECPIYHVMQRGVPSSLDQEVFWRKDGTNFPVEYSSFPIFQRDTIHGAVITFNDISKRKQSEDALRASEQKYRELIDNANDLIFALALDGRILSINPAFEKISGWSQEDAQGKHFSEFIHPENLEAAMIHFAETLHGQPSMLREYRFLHRTNAEFFGEVLTYPHVIDGKIAGVFGILRDVTERKKAERELLAAKEKAEVSEKLKDAFIANMSHEIRTPLNVIMGYSNFIVETYRDTFGEEEKIFFSSIEQGGQRLMRTVEHMLNISSIQTGIFPMHPEELDLVALLTDRVRALQHDAKEKNIEVHCIYDVESVRCLLDRYSIEQAFINLLDNAVKFTNKGSISLGLSVAAGYARITISDTGVGIASDYLPDVFRTYSQENVSYTRQYQGLGLGLALTKRYVELNGGTISVQSEKGSGTTFTIDIPLVNSVHESVRLLQPDSGITQDKTASDPTLPVHLLVVEDDTLSQEYMRIILSPESKIFFAKSADEAWKILFSERIDMIFMDLSLDGPMDGIQLTSRLKQDVNFHSIPIIALTAHAFALDRKKSLDAGCDEFLPKPYQRQRLEEVLKKYLGARYL